MSSETEIEEIELSVTLAHIKGGLQPQAHTWKAVAQRQSMTVSSGHMVPKISGRKLASQT